MCFEIEILKKGVQLFLNFDGKMHLDTFIYFHFYSNFVETVIKIKLKTLFIKYTVTLHFQLSSYHFL